MVEIGDRVRSVVDSPDNNDSIVIGSTGTVVYIDAHIIFVDWDEDVGGHDCDGRAREEHGWNVTEDQIEVIQTANVQYEVDEDEFKRMFGLV